ncbi:hypothetical protein R6Q57_000796 [Mikania cordata]
MLQSIYSCDHTPRDAIRQPAAVAVAGGGGGGLSRFRSAPAAWLEALLESEEEEDGIIDPPKPPKTPPVHQHASNAGGHLYNLPSLIQIF